MFHSAEKKLLLACVCPGKEHPEARAVALAQKALDWDYLLRTALENQIAPLLRQALRDAGGSVGIPETVSVALRQACHLTAFQNALIYEELERLLRVFTSERLPVVVLKGAALAGIVWRNIALRPMADTDLLVREEDLPRADELLRSREYTPVETYRPADWYSGHHHLAPYRKRGRELVVELHRNIVVPNNDFSLDMRRIWERARATRISGAEALTLCPEDLVTHLCLHMSVDDSFAGKIRDLGDIARVLTHYQDDIDWDLVVGEAIRRRFARYLYYPLYFVRALCGVDVNSEILKRLRGATGMGRLQDRTLKALIGRCLLMTHEGAALVPKWFMAALCEKWLRRGSMAGRIASLSWFAFGPHVPTQGIARPAPGLSARVCRPFARVLGFCARMVSAIWRDAFGRSRADVTLRE